MILLHWFSVCCFLKVASAGLRNVLLTVNDFVERHGGVKIILLREPWLIAVDRWLNSGSNASKRDRNASITYEILGTTEDIAGEDFQNRGTFIVVRSSVFAISSAQKTHLARDAYNAY
ncbi:MAG: hypothetical protein K0U82_06285, partial [Planctomycetes bacterium]|nr:hypothetical protein [Planctomycetota bacterium]